MRISLATLAFLTLLTLVAGPALGMPAPISISISGPTSPIKIGKAIQITVTMKNISASVISIGEIGGESGGDFMFRSDMRNAEGLPLPHTDYGKAVLGEADAKSPAASNAIVFVKLGPGDVISKTMNIGDIFLLNSAGTYTIVVRKFIPEILSGGEIVSNTVNVEVVN